MLGDGEFDSVELQSYVNDLGWDYVCRTAKNTQVCLDGEWLSLQLSTITIFAPQRQLEMPTEPVESWAAVYPRLS
ncbi:MAG: hypothetical protein BroJett021_29870 [Chloroflexota bacterium]|nr:MAG: hypothetical protein BroJett021_29870 [Chloroflexota bacterium]